VGLAKRILHHAQFTRRRRQTLDRGDLVAVGLNGEHETGPRRLAVYQHRAGAADALLATGVAADQ
jgi:hypothetical protein